MARQMGPPRGKRARDRDKAVERKRAERDARDDRARLKLLASMEGEPDGLVLAHYGSHADTLLPDGSVSFALLAPKVHKLWGLSVGDRVWTGDGASAGERVILARAERRSEVRRRRSEEDRTGHVIAANVDRMAITAALHEPPLRTGALDRYLLLASVLCIEPLVVVTKIDQTGRESPEWSELEAYAGLAPVVATSAVSGEGLDELREHLASRVTVFAGHSGVGKSSLCQALGLDNAPEAGPMSRSGGRVRGRHTTSVARLLPLPFGGWVVDTPGVRSIGLVDLEPADVAVHFPEFAEPALACRYEDCRHVDEKRCGVQAAVEAGDIPEVRYEGYVRLLESLTEQA